MRTAHDIILAPVVSEKSTEMSTESKYVFKVDRNSTKIEVAKAIESLFAGVKVKSVNIQNCKGKPKRVPRTGRMGSRADWRKAVVTLAEGTIEIV